ncbi:MAG: hypothetical protein OXI67_21040 [Candidatus Poribacteria bacterium]|nr:hypothetical protein [Candidatus Poribacteria bacterium]
MYRYLPQLACLLSLIFLFSCGENTDDTNNPQISYLPQNNISKEREASAKSRYENPEVWADQNLTRLIEEHGDIPDVHTVAGFMRKVELGSPRSDAECRTYIDTMRELTPERLTMDEYYVLLEAEFQLGILDSDIGRCRLEVFRALKAEGTSFQQIRWDELDENNRFCQTEDLRRTRLWHSPGTYP